VFGNAEATSFALSLPGTAFPVLSQGEHPTSGSPQWYLHPCETRSAMLELLEAAAADKENGKGTDEEMAHWMEVWFLIAGNVLS
jgi:ubiquitin-like-conjugating enzyme ATG10